MVFRTGTPVFFSRLVRREKWPNINILDVFATRIVFPILYCYKKTRFHDINLYVLNGLYCFFYNESENFD